MNRLFLKVARFIVSNITIGRSVLIRIALFLFGHKFNGVITTLDGRKIYIASISLVKQHLFFLNTYEDYETHVVQCLVRKGDTVFDVGASFGWFATLMGKCVGDSGKVFAFELVPNVAEECRYNVRLNNLEHIVVVEEIGLADSDGEVTFHYSEDLGLGNLRLDGFTGGGKLISGKTTITTLDHYVGKNHIQKLDFIKCDVDGAEVLFLRGARKTLLSERPVVMIEASGSHGRSSCYDIFNELNQCDYKFFSLHYKKRLREIKPSEFGGKFKENILCLPSSKLGLLAIL